MGYLKEYQCRVSYATEASLKSLDAWICIRQNNLSCPSLYSARSNLSSVSWPDIRRNFGNVDWIKFLLFELKSLEMSEMSFTESKDRGYVNAVAFLDLKKAFDTDANQLIKN